MVAGPTKRPFRNRSKVKQEQKQKPRNAIIADAAQATWKRADSRNCQITTASTPEPGELPLD
jgi:phage portal protein BeeE